LKRKEENQNSARIFNLNSGNLNEKIEEKSFQRKKNYNDNKILGRTGSLTTLFERTDNNEKREKLHSTKMTKDSNFFAPADKPPKRIKQTVNYGLDSKDPLNTKIPDKEIFDINNKSL
jgi:hypothetical protein